MIVANRKMNKKINDIALNGIFIAILVIMGMVPNLGIIQVGAVSITIMHIPVIVIALVKGYKSGFIAGLAFGLLSFFVALQRAATPVDILFQNPLVSVVPRMLFPLVGVWLYSKLSGVLRNDRLNIGISSFLMSFIHTILVLTILYLVDAPTVFGVDAANFNNVMTLIISIFTVNAVFEATTAVLISIPVVRALKRY